MSISSSGPCTLDNPFTHMWTTNVMVRYPDGGPVPDTATYIQKLEREREARERGETKDNRSFLAKYVRILNFIDNFTDFNDIYCHDIALTNLQKVLPVAHCLLKKLTNKFNGFAWVFNFPCEARSTLSSPSLLPERNYFYHMIPCIGFFQFRFYMSCKFPKLGNSCQIV